MGHGITGHSMTRCGIMGQWYNRAWHDEVW